MLDDMLLIWPGGLSFSLGTSGLYTNAHWESALVVRGQIFEHSNNYFTIYYQPPHHTNHQFTRIPCFIFATFMLFSFMTSCVAFCIIQINKKLSIVVRSSMALTKQEDLNPLIFTGFTAHLSRESQHSNLQRILSRLKFLLKTFNMTTTQMIQTRPTTRIQDLLPSRFFEMFSFQSR